MKLLPILALLLTSSIYSQTTHVSNNVYFSLGMVIANDFIYASYSSNCVAKVDLNQEISQKCIVNEDDTNFPKGLLLNGNDLYITGSGRGIISKIDITKETPDLITIIDNLNNPSDIAIKDNVLFIADQNEISYLTISDTNSKTTFKSIAVNGIQVYKNYLVAFDNSSIIKIDMSTLEVITIIDNITPLAIEIINDNLLFSEGNSISLLDLSLTNPTKTTFLESVSNVRAIEFYNDELYVAEYDNSRVLKVDAATLSIQKDKPLIISEIFPNPVENFIYFKENLQIGDSFKIIDIKGRTLQTGKISNVQQLNVSDLNSGLYFLSLRNGSFKKFIKR